MQEFFEFSLGARVQYKTGLARELAGEVQNLGGTRVFVITDSGVVGAGLLAPIIESIASEVEIVGVFDAVPPNSSVHAVEAAAAQARAAGADLLLAVGGGSPIDTAKGVRILLTNEGSLLDYQGYNVLSERLKPLIVIPTTAGTGSEVTNVAVILDTDNDLKLIYASPFLTPDLAVLDPELTLSLPPRLTAVTGMDALTHAIESYVSTEHNPFSDSMGLFAIDMLASNLREATHNGRDLEARQQVLIASCMAGIAFSNAFLGAVHALSHAVGGLFHVHHGTLNAIFLPHVMEFNSVVVPHRYAQVARALGVIVGGRSDAEVIADGVAAVRTLMTDIGVPMRLRDVEVPEAALEEIAAIALTDGTIFHNPRTATEEDLVALARAAW